MKKLVLILGLFLSLSANAWAQDDAVQYQHIKQQVKKFKDILKTNNPQLIAKNVIYPFIIGENCPPLQNEREFIKNYNIILSSELLSEIISSNKKLWHLDENKDGIFYDFPYVQLSLDGELIDLEYTFQRKKYNEQCLLREKSEIYPSLQTYIKNLYILKTPIFIYRLDLVDDFFSTNKYRLAIWKTGQKFSEKPLKIINKGKLELYGSANNEKYIFLDNNKSYILQINTARALETPPFEIIITDENSVKKYPAENLPNNSNLYQLLIG